MLTEDAELVCDHVQGTVQVRVSQDWVTVEGRSVLVARNPERRPITGCPNAGPTIKPCQMTLNVEAGYSDLVHVEGRSVCMDTLTGRTDGTPPGTVDYSVRTPGQTLVSTNK